MSLTYGGIQAVRRYSQMIVRSCKKESFHVKGGCKRASMAATKKNNSVPHRSVISPIFAPASVPEGRLSVVSLSLMADKRIIVTGGAGFIGSALVWGLNELGVDDILIVDRLDENDKWKNLA